MVYTKKEVIHSKDYSYNNNLHTRESHNCYTYFLNLKSKKAYNLCKDRYNSEHICRRPQPGYASNMPLLKRSDYNCKTMMNRTLKDNPRILRTTKKAKCPATHYKGALVVSPNKDYHYYRLNDDNVWTHKPGHKPSTNQNADMQPITDPETANRTYNSLDYKDFCGFLCVPRSRNKKTMKMYSDINKHKQHTPLNQRMGNKR